MPLRTVSETDEPMETAPRNSKMTARKTACLMVRDPAPTEEAYAFATSFAPMPYAAPNACDEIL